MRDDVLLLLEEMTKKLTQNSLEAYTSMFLCMNTTVGLLYSTWQFLVAHHTVHCRLHWAHTVDDALLT